MPYQRSQEALRIVKYFNYLRYMVPIMPALLLAVAPVPPAMAASPEYCTVYAQASADPKGTASGSASDTETLQRVYDKAYFECLNADDEPAIPDEFLARSADDPVVSEGDSDAGDEKPVVKKEPKGAKTASADLPRKKKRWTSGFPKGTAGWQAWCEDNYKSFDVKTGTYTSYSGEKKPCK